jgi:hypothetical protein
MIAVSSPSARARSCLPLFLVSCVAPLAPFFAPPQKRTEAIGLLVVRYGNNSKRHRGRHEVTVNSFTLISPFLGLGKSKKYQTI